MSSNDDITIPPEAVEAAARAMFIEAYRREPDEQTDGARFNLVRQFTLAALRAGIAAWPGAQDSGLTYGTASTRIYILPLPTENTNAEG